MGFGEFFGRRPEGRRGRKGPTEIVVGGDLDATHVPTPATWSFPGEDGTMTVEDRLKIPGELFEAGRDLDAAAAKAQDRGKRPAR